MEVKSDTEAWLAECKMHAHDIGRNTLEAEWELHCHEWDDGLKLSVMTRMHEHRRSADALRGAILRFDPRWRFQSYPEIQHDS